MRTTRQQPTNQLWASFQTEGNRQRELAVANHFLCMHPDRFPAALVSAADFIAIPDIGHWWDEAAAKQAAGEPWTFVDVARGGWRPGSDGTCLADHVTDATAMPHQMPQMQRKMVEQSSMIAPSGAWPMTSSQ